MINYTEFATLIDAQSKYSRVYTIRFCLGNSEGDLSGVRKNRARLLFHTLKIQMLCEYTSRT